MNKTYQIDVRHQIKSFSYGLRILTWFPMALAVAYFSGLSDSLFDADFLPILIIYNLVCFLPAFVLHITYYLANRGMNVTIDPSGRSITIVNRYGECQLKTDDIKKVERVLYNDYKHLRWQQNWIPVPWRNYGYIRVTTEDDKVFLLTSLLLDPLNPPVQPTVTKYSFIPFLNAEVEEETTLEESEEDHRAEIEAYKAKFQNHTEEELTKKTITNGYRKVAVIAANELLEERNTIAHNAHGA